MFRPKHPWVKPKVKVDVRRRLRRTGLNRVGYGAFRFAVYGFLGVALEVVFYNLVRTFQDVPVLQVLFAFRWRVDPLLELDRVWSVPGISLYGQCSLWMFLVYGVACFAIEQLYLRVFGLHLALRALLYGLLIFSWECASGWVLKAVTGYEIWFYEDAGAFFRMTSWFILPIWVLTGVLVEYIFRQLMDPDVVQALETVELDPQFAPSGDRRG